VFDVLHRPGNVHDSRGAREFILACIDAVREALPRIQLEVRMDGAFFSDEIVRMLDQQAVEFTISVPFERLAVLKRRIEAKRHWRWFDCETAYFELRWKPKAWRWRHRFVVIRSEQKLQTKGAVQLDLFVPYQYGFEFKVIVTNKATTAKKVLAFHNGRGAQEGVFADLKSQAQLDYIAVRRLHGNQTYLLAAVLAHNLGRELQMASRPPERATNEKRCTLWIFQELSTLRRTFIQRAGRLTRPNNNLTLTMSANPAVQDELLSILDALRAEA
jgi:hypothetical protein